MGTPSHGFRIGTWAMCLLAFGAACKGDVQNDVAASRVDDGGATPSSASAPPSPDASMGFVKRDAGGSSLDARVSMGAAPKDGGSAGRDASADTTTQGTTSEAGALPADARVMDEGTPVIVAVGYLGLRVMSRDRGRSWEHQQTLRQPGGELDDMTLLRAVAYGHDLFVAAGHRIFTSPDAITWTERVNPQNQWVGGVQWGNDRFVAAGGYGESWYSTDGQEWMAGGRRSNNSHVRSVAFGNGEFRAANDAGEWWRSENGESWELMAGGGHDKYIGFCDGTFRDASACPPPFGNGVYIEGGDWDENVIRYSDDGRNWQEVSVTYTGSLTGIAFGIAR